MTERLSTILWRETKFIIFTYLAWLNFIFWLDLKDANGGTMRDTLAVSLAVYVVFIYSVIFIYALYRHLRYKNVRW